MGMAGGVIVVHTCKLGAGGDADGAVRVRVAEGDRGTRRAVRSVRGAV